MKDVQFQLILILFLILTLVFTTFSLKSNQDIRNFAKEPTSSEQSAQLQASPTPIQTTKIDTQKITENLKQTTITLNNAASSFFQQIATTVIAGVLFVLIFYLLIKKFLK